MRDSYPISGKLITKAVRQISSNTGMNIKTIEYMYATQLGCSLATIHAWKVGKSRPTSRDAIWIIAKDAVERGKLGKDWLMTFADELNLPAGLKVELLDIVSGNKELQKTSIAKKLSLFLCHSSLDKTAVQDLYGKLKSDGFEPWLDEKVLLPGQEWELEIRRAVQNSDVVIICLSESSISKEGFVQKEIKLALDIADEKPQDIIFLIPLRLKQCNVPDVLAKWQWVDLFNLDGYTKLVVALKKRAQQLGKSIGDIDENESSLIGDSKKRTKLFEYINNKLSMQDINEICFKLYIDFDNLGGRTRAEKGMELVLYCERVGRLAELEIAITTIKPK